MQYRLFYCFFVLILSIFGNFGAVLSQTTDSIRQVNIPGIQITDQRAQYSLRMREVEGIGIFAAKKSDVVLPENANANLALNNTRQVLGKVPGLTLWENDGSGLQNNIACRGLSPNRSWEFNTRQNGYDISADNFGYPEAYYAPPMEAVRRIEIVRGASSLQFGPQIGGLLNYVLKNAPDDRRFSIESRQTAGSFGLFNTYNAIGGTLGKFQYFGYGQYRRGDGWRDNSGFETNNFHLNLGYNISEKLHLGLEVTRANYVLQQAGGLTDAQWADNPRQSLRSRNWFSAPWTTAALRLDWNPGKQTKLQTRLFGLSGERNSIGFLQNITVRDTILATTGQYANRQIDRFDFNNLGLESRLLHEYHWLGNQHALAAGVRLYQADQQRRQRGKGDTGTDYNLDLQTDAFPFDINFGTQNAAVFVENIFRKGRLALIPGLRYEFIRAKAEGRINRNTDGSPVLAKPEQRDRQLLLAGLGAEIHLWGHTEFYLNTATSYRPVLFSDLVPGATLDEIDPALKDGKGHQMDFGFRGDWKEWLRFDVGVYWLNYQNRIGTLNLLKPDGKTTFLYRTNVGQSRSYGTELYMEIDLLKPFTQQNRWGNVQVFAALSWMNTRYGNFETSTVQNGAVVRGNLKNNRVEYAPDYVHRMGITYSYRTFSTSFSINSMSAVFTDAGNTVVPSANGQAGQLPAYRVMDWSANWHIGKYYLLSAGVNNLSDARYATRRASGYPGPGLLPADGRSFYVTVGVKI